MKSPLRAGAVRAPEFKLLTRAAGPQTDKARRIASLSAAAAIVVGVGAASALFVDYLADRALARAAEAPVAAKPVATGAVVARAAVASPETTVAALAPGPVAAPSQPVEPPKAEIAAAMPDPAAIASVAVGPEHAIELPTEDPTASPIVKADVIAGPDDTPAAGDVAVYEEVIAAYSEDDTQTAAIDPETDSDIDPGAAGPALEEQPVKKPKRSKAAEQAQPREAGQQTEIAALPGVDVGGLAGHRSGETNADSTVRTITKETKDAGGVGSARVTAAVNLRSSPKKGAEVLTVVPAGSAVNVLSCDGWCQVAYNGRKGWVYKNFLTTASSARPQQKQPAAKQASSGEPAAPAPRKTLSSRASDG